MTQADIIFFVQKLRVCNMFHVFETSSIMINKAAFIWFKNKINIIYFNIYKNVIYSSEGSRDPSEIILICWKQFLVSMLKGIVPVFLWKPWLFFQNSLINKKLKRTEFISHWNVLQHYKCVYSHYDNLHPCGIKAQISYSYSYRIKKNIY